MNLQNGGGMEEARAGLRQERANDVALLAEANLLRGFEKVISYTEACL